MDDTKVAEVVPRRQPGDIQSGVHAVENWSCEHKMTLNADKCQVMNIDFKKNRHAFEPVIVDRKELSVVSSAKILGVTLSGDVTWMITCLRLLTKPLRDYTSWFFLKERM